MIDDLPVDLTG